MNSTSELAIPAPKKPELHGDRLLLSLEHSLSAIEDSKIQQFVKKLFFSGGFLFEAKEFGSQRTEIQGIVCAHDDDHVYEVRLIEGENPLVNLQIKNREGEEIAFLTLSTPPNIRPDVWNMWLNSSKNMTIQEKSEHLEKFLHAKLDPTTTRKVTITEIWKTLRGLSPLDIPKVFGNFRTMGRTWGDFIDSKHNVVHPLSPPQDVLYSFKLEEDQTNLLDEPNSENVTLRRKVQKSCSQRNKDLFRIITHFEGITGHQVILLQRMDFDILPTKIGLDIFNRLKQTIPTMVSGLTDDEITFIFDWIGNETLTWDFVDPQLSGGIEDGLFRQLDYVAPEEKPFSKDETDQEYAQRINAARKFRFLAQIFAQKMKEGVKWRFTKNKSEALRQLSAFEKLPLEEIIRKYNI